MRTKNAMKNIVSSLLLQLVTILCGFITPVLIISTYGSKINGLLSSITQFLSYIALLESGFGPVLKSMLYKPLAQKNEKELCSLLKSGEIFFRKIAFIFIIYIFVLAIIYPIFINNNYDFLFTSSLIIIIAISSFFEYFFGITYKLFLQAEQKTYITSYIQLFTLVINTILIVIMVKNNFSIHIVKLVSSLIYVLRPIMQNIYIKLKYSLKINKDTPCCEIKQKWAGLSQHIAGFIHNGTDVTLLTVILKDISEVSVYSVYYLIVSGLRKIISSLISGIDSLFGDLFAKGEYEKLKISFELYELVFHSICIVIFSTCLCLIIPFIKIYTNGINDANYIRPVFAHILVLGEFVYSVRLPYNNLVLALGHFKQTTKGSWVEAFTNIFLSIILVYKYGIVGVAIGTFVAMLVRTIELVLYVDRNILKRDKLLIIKKTIMIFLTMLVIVFFANVIISSFKINNYLTWCFASILIIIISSILVAISNYFFYNNDSKLLYKQVLMKIRKKV